MKKDKALLEDENFIRTSPRWPMWPHLPMKLSTGTGWPEAGFFFNKSFDPNDLVFYKGNLWGGKEEWEETALTVDEVLEAGWRVD